jgi:hypothetical protein
MRANRDRNVTRLMKEGRKETKRQDHYYLKYAVCDQFRANLVLHLKKYHGMTDRKEIQKCLAGTERMKRSVLNVENYEPKPVLKRIVPAFEHFHKSPMGSGFSQTTGKTSLSLQNWIYIVLMRYI